MFTRTSEPGYFTLTSMQIPFIIIRNFTGTFKNRSVKSQGRIKTRFSVKMKLGCHLTRFQIKLILIRNLLRIVSVFVVP